jgi:putative photosynthetic complex assembly protein 2
LDQPWIAALVALFVWWFSTGAILWAVKRADGRGRGAHGRVVLCGLPVLVAGVAGTIVTAGQPGAVYVPFLSALAIWGWVELAFLTGCVTGPSRSPMPCGTSGGQRFRAAWAVLAWHEILLTLGLLGLWALTRGAANDLAFWTYAVLWGARISAKLNIFLGVPRINVEFLPAPLSHLPSYFRHGPVSWFFPVSILALTAAVLCWIERVVTTGETGFALLASLTALALLEHWLMVVPLPDAKLWRWALPAPKTTLPEGEGRHGF